MENVVNKKDLAEKLAEQFGCTKKDAQAYVNAVFEEITNVLVDGGAVDVFGFGKFSVTERAGREGINPSTKERITIAATKSVKFKAAKALKEAVK
ncbi:MAG: HU family DNA-binding protein [Firmicutes bacterium]|nr:HU family DNA-binding protein [Bacillota bacterium]